MIDEFISDLDLNSFLLGITFTFICLIIQQVVFKFSKRNKNTTSSIEDLQNIRKIVIKKPFIDLKQLSKFEIVDLDHNDINPYKSDKNEN